MKIEEMHIGMAVRHPQYGTGTVTALTSDRASIQFSDAIREVAPGLSELLPAEATASLSGLRVPLPKLILEVVEASCERLAVGRPDEVVEQLGRKWKGGMLIIKPADPTLQPKEIDLETFFHKIVMMRNNLRVLEQKVNSLEQLSSVEKFDLQQYITRCYGSMTTFNVLFRNKEDQFSTQK